jgi:aminoglycoside N3'-acetyltransferase
MSIKKTLSRIKRSILRSITVPTDSRTIETCLRGAGVNRGDTIYLTSSLSAIGRVVGGPETVLSALENVVGPLGTIAAPAHLDPQIVLKTAAGDISVDLRDENNHTGAIPRQLLRRHNAKRSSHPYASTVAVGTLASWLTESHQTGPEVCHKDSPFARLIETNASLVGIGTGFSAMGIYHCIEDLTTLIPNKVYSELKEVHYIERSGLSTLRLIYFYDQTVAASRIEKPSSFHIRRFTERYFEMNNILRYFYVGNACCWIMKAKELYAAQIRLAEKGITIYSTQCEIDEAVKAYPELLPFSRYA